MGSVKDEPLQGSLFGWGGIDLQGLRERRESLRNVVRAPTTVRGYGQDWRTFARWCQEAGRNALPASSDTVSLYIASLLDVRKLKVSSAERHVSAIRHYHRQSGLPQPIGEDTRMILAGVRRERREKPQGKAALAVDDLMTAAKACDETNLGRRDRAVLVLGFATSLRRSEIAELQLSDVCFVEQGLVLTVGRSKTDQAGKGRLIPVWNGVHPETDPVAALKEWLERRGSWDGALFCRIQRYDTIKERGVTGLTINHIVKRCLRNAGIDPKRYGAHSLRAGAVTASAELGRSDQEIMNLSGHVDPKVMRMYVRRERLFAGRNPLEGVL